MEGGRPLDKIIVVALGGAIGAVARYWLGGLVNSRWPMPFPLGTFVVNITGSFIIGCFLTLASERLTMHPHWRLLIAVGFIGAYTTFSTFEYETLKLIEEGNILSALGNVVLSVAVGFIAVWLGVAAARRLEAPITKPARQQTVVVETGSEGGKTGE
ncbi:MAG: fluoride efflux transporter CrcB [Acidobacteriota bacterium]|nr:MAG: fluoride efflux transporter CrcB [Acidobacteriota bacterium]